ncbi:hypothetical protein EMQ_1352 [Acetobacter aceti NBRC 14818]|uniref:Uncharacterized protein n=1 Tax=Acetobacter aceti NBRC 14818 TaxID=887700 RepID=A0AB33IDA0_ACEAC|nr:hypothetical protein EMQ_1352 [Acetobacter aceti NBRC 14818]GAN57925.1 hypothetical protein Abac_022_058 [Acetobacter aceti NBRC 14818]
MTAYCERAIHGAGDFCIFHFDATTEQATRSNGQLLGVDHAGLDSAFNHETLCILHGALNADATTDDECAAVITGSIHG